MSETAESEVPYRVQSVDRAIDILQSFTFERPIRSLGEVAKETGLTKPTASRLLTTLRLRGLVRRDPATGQYSLGSGVPALGAVWARQSGYLERALPIMRGVRDALNETVSLAVREGDYRVQLYQLESLQSLRRTTHSGDRSPLYAGAANKLLLSAMSDTEIDRYLKRTPLTLFTPHTITDTAELRREIERIRRQGYAVSHGEKYADGASAAAPVRDAVGQITATLYVSVPATRFSDDLRDRCIKVLVRSAEELSAELGYRPFADPS